MKYLIIVSWQLVSKKKKQTNQNLERIETAEREHSLIPVGRREAYLGRLGKVVKGMGRFRRKMVERLWCRQREHVWNICVSGVIAPLGTVMTSESIT